MKVFLSWSGDGSRRYANQLSQWLPLVIQSVKPFYSAADVEKGSRWNEELSRELQATNYGVLCITKDNVSAPWINYEAGALSKFLDKSKVCPVLFGLKPADVPFPIAQFQCAPFCKEEILKLVKGMNEQLPTEKKISEIPLNKSFEMWWPELEKEVDKIMKESERVETVEEKRPDRDILEEILSLVRHSERRASVVSERRLPSALIDDVTFAADEVESTFVSLLRINERKREEGETSECEECAAQLNKLRVPIDRLNKAGAYLKRIQRRLEREEIVVRD